MVVELWDMTRVARGFGVSMSTVQASWRHDTLTAVRAHLDAAGVDGQWMVPVERLTDEVWQRARRELGIGPLRLPRSALPLPDAIVARSPAWTEATLRRWAVATERVTADGGLRRASPPGRPKGSTDSRPRRRQGVGAGTT